MPEKRRFFYQIHAIILASMVALSSSALAGQETRPKLLFIGDSHSQGVFGDTLDGLVRENYSVASFGVGGSTPEWWEKGIQTPWAGWSRSSDGTEIRDNKPFTPRLSELVTQQKPNVVVIEQGTNLIWADQKGLVKTDAEVEAQVKTLIQTAKQSGSACVWIGPPHLGAHVLGKGISESQQFAGTLDHVRNIEIKVTAQNGCTFVDSYPVTRYPDQGGDGIHYDRAGAEGVKAAKAWAIYVKKKLDEAVKPVSWPSHVWKLKPPANDPSNHSYALNQWGLEDHCGWTKPPRSIFNGKSTLSHIVTECAGGRASCQVSWTDANNANRSGNFFLNFRCRTRSIATHGYPSNTEPAQMDWLPNFSEECDSVASFKVQDLRVAGCEPDGSIAPDLNSPSGPSRKSDEAR